MRDLSGRDYEKILIIKPSSFGDVIHALPVLNGLRQRFPRAHISWLVSTACAALLEGHPALDEIIRFDRKHYGKIGRSWRATLDFIRFVRQLRTRQFDLVLDLQGLFRSGFLARASGAKTRVGFASARELAWIFYSHRVDVPDRDMHAVDRNYRFAEKLGFADVPITFALPVQPKSHESIERMLMNHGLQPGEPYALIVPGTRWETKRWPAEHFATVASAIRTEHHLAVVLAGAPDEVEVADRVRELAGQWVVNLAGQTSLLEMAALVAGASIVVMNDTGPMHLAVALKKPLVALYGPTNPSRTGPYGRSETVVRLDLPCSPCYLKRLSQCPHDHRCMNQITPQTVAQRVSSVLSSGVH